MTTFTDPTAALKLARDALENAVDVLDEAQSYTACESHSPSMTDECQRAARIARAALAAIDALPAPSGEPADPMDWPLPCDVKVGHGTMRKGVRLGTLVARMKVLYEMATGRNADEVAARTLAQRQAMAGELFNGLTEAETSATASVAGLTAQAAPAPLPMSYTNYDDPEDDPPAREASDWSPPVGYDGDGSVAAMAARTQAATAQAAPAPQAEPTDSLRIALDALDEIALAGMSGTGQESEDGMQAWHARQAWKFIGIAARAKSAIAALPAPAAAAPVQPRQPLTEAEMLRVFNGPGLSPSDRFKLSACLFMRIWRLCEAVNGITATPAKG